MGLLAELVGGRRDGERFEMQLECEMLEFPVFRIAVKTWLEYLEQCDGAQMGSVLPTGVQHYRFRGFGDLGQRLYDLVNE